MVDLKFCSTCYKNRGLKFYRTRSGVELAEILSDGRELPGESYFKKEGKLFVKLTGHKVLEFTVFIQSNAF
jgi:hypothetical protein